MQSLWVPFEELLEAVLAGRVGRARSPRPSSPYDALKRRDKVVSGVANSSAAREGLGSDEGRRSQGSEGPRVPGRASRRSAPASSPATVTRSYVEPRCR